MNEYQYDDSIESLNEQKLRVKKSVEIHLGAEIARTQEKINHLTKDFGSLHATASLYFRT